MKATPTLTASNPDDVCRAVFNNADEVMLTSPSQNKVIPVYDSTPSNKDLPDRKTMAVIAVMRGKPKDGYHRCQNILRGYLYDGDLVIIILKGISIF
jgi:hypothetical protein